MRARGKQLFLQQICLPGLPHRGLQEGQGLRGSSASGGGRPLDSGLDVSLAEESQRLASRTPMPNFNLSDDEARDLTAFLTTLKEHKKRGRKVKRFPVGLLALLLVLPGCTKRGNVNPSLSSKVYGAQIVQVSGDKQAAGVGSKLRRSGVVQVNGADGSALAGALVSFQGDGLVLIPPRLSPTPRTGERFRPSLAEFQGATNLSRTPPKPGGGSTTINVREMALDIRRSRQGSELQVLHYLP